MRQARIPARALAALLLGCFPALAESDLDDVAAVNERRNPLVEMVARAKQAVVFIRCNATRVTPVASIFGGRRGGRQEQLQSQGSGVVVYSEGYVVTNYHVVEGATEIDVLFDDDRSYKAELLSFEAEEDLALLKIQAGEEFPVIDLADDEVYLAETVIAIGNPHGRTHTVSKGIVSGLYRDVEARSNNGRMLRLEGLIQTDAAINSGNSGGPLLNVHGELLGINTVMETNAENIGFAIPVTRVRSVLKEHLLPSARRFASLGFEVEPTTLVITSVTAGGPAADADIQVGDRVVALGGKRLESPDDWPLARAAIVPFAEVPVVVVREDTEHTSSVVAWNRLDALAFERFGARVEPRTYRFPARDAWGRSGYRPRMLLSIVELRPEGPAEALGLAVGDLLDTVETAGAVGRNAYEFRTWQDFPMLLSRLPKDAELVVNVWRDRDEDGTLDRSTELYEGRIVLQ
ncbi:MAG: trypsin-like peptidase domain-containing protein [Planctomycetota bacterium]